MKKLYFSLLALLTVLSSYAISEVPGIKSHTENLGITHNIRKTVRQLSPAKAASRAESDDDSYTWILVGDGKAYVSSLVDTYGSQAVLEDVKIYKAYGTNGIFKVQGIWSSVTENGSLIIDATNPDKVVVPTQDTGLLDSEDGVTYIASMSYLVADDDWSSYSLYNITLKDNVLNIPANSLLLNWPEAPANSKYETNPKTWYYTGATAGYITFPDGEYKDSWSLIPGAEFKENLLYGVFLGTAESPAENTEFIEVDLYENAVTPGVYKVINPFVVLYSEMGIGDVVSPDLVIDATNPDNVIISETSAGFRSKTEGLYSYMSVSYYETLVGATVDDTAEEYRIKLTNDGEYTTITFPVYSTVLYADATEAWGYSSLYESVLRFKATSGVNNISTKENSGKVTYYNLQGEQVQNPNGGIFIRVQNGKASKVVVK
jgi:hypothetical protein